VKCAELRVAPTRDERAGASMLSRSACCFCGTSQDAFSPRVPFCGTSQHTASGPTDSMPVRVAEHLAQTRWFSNNETRRNAQEQVLPVEPSAPPATEAPESALPPASVAPEPAGAAVAASSDGPPAPPEASSETGTACMGIRVVGARPFDHADPEWRQSPTESLERTPGHPSMGREIVRQPRVPSTARARMP
jgi:hypothetical protein